MQYKIPVQVENEDKLFLNLSLRQIIIIMIWFSLAYTVFKWLEKSSWSWAIALFPSWIIAFIAIFIAVFKNSEMTFMPFIFNLIRLNVNSSQRTWSKWVDCYSKVEIWYVPPELTWNEKMVSTKSSEVHEDILSKI